MPQIFAKPASIHQARQLRHHSTEVEKRLWYRLRARQVEGCKFRRQHPISGYVLDFACEERKLAIELDGGQHNLEAIQVRNANRSALLAQSGWCVLWFWNHDVLENMEGVLLVIQQALTRNHEG